MSSLLITCFPPLGLDLLARRIVPSAQNATRLLRWPYSSISTPLSFASPQDDPSLRALYEPYPTEAPSEDIFESESVVYEPMVSATTQVTQEPRTSKLQQQPAASLSQLPHVARSNTALVESIRQGNFAAAISLRRDLDALHTPIAENNIYAEVACHLLESPDQTNPHAFLDWCQLVPNISDPWSKSADTPAAMLMILDRLIQKPENIDIICRFSVLAARKGMARRIAIPVIGHVTRYSTPEIASRLLRRLTKVSAQSGLRAGSSTIPPKTQRSWNSTFIRVLCLSGRINAARRSLWALHNDKRAIAPSAYRIVAEELETLGCKEYAEQVRALCEEAGYPRPVFPVRAFVNYKTAPMPGGTVLRQLLWVKQRIDAHLAISVNDLASFMRTCLGVRRHRALLLLRSRLIRLSKNRAWKNELAPWGIAEMQLYRRENKHEDVLQVFSSTFLPIGITKQLLSELQSPQSSVTSPPKTSPSLWPPSEALALASWSAAFLASSPSDHGLLERCYALFLKGCTPAAGAVSQLPPVMKPDAAAFQPWIGAFARRLGPDGIVRVMEDMRQLGIPPSIMTWNALAKAYVTKGEWGIARSILARMESARDQTPPDVAARAQIRLRTRLGPIADWGFPAANLSTYYTLLRELWMTKQIPAIWELIERLIRSGYQGGDERLDSFIDVVKRSRDGPKP